MGIDVAMEMAQSHKNARNALTGNTRREATVNTRSLYGLIGPSCQTHNTGSPEHGTSGVLEQGERYACAIGACFKILDLYVHCESENINSPLVWMKTLVPSVWVSQPLAEYN